MIALDLVPLLVVDERRVERELPQPGERGEDRDPVRLGVVEQAEHALALALELA